MTCYGMAYVKLIVTLGVPYVDMRFVARLLTTATGTSESTCLPIIAHQAHHLMLVCVRTDVTVAGTHPAEELKILVLHGRNFAFIS